MSDEQKEREALVTDERLETVFAGTNFGANAVPRDIVANTLLKVAGDFSTGHTALVCCQELGLIGANKREPKLTKKGRRYLYYAYSRTHESKAVGWEPIDTAPKDGIIVLVYYKNCLGKDRIIKAMYIRKYTEENDGDHAEYCEERDQYYTPEGWYECCDNWDEYSHFAIISENVPTHWQPLPDTPSLAASGYLNLKEGL
jgi:hypothetical protein